MKFVRTVAVAGIVIGCIAILLPLAVLDGFHKELRDKAVSFASHVTIKTFTQAPIFETDTIIAKVKRKYSYITNITPVLEQGAILKRKDNTDGVMIYGCVDSLTKAALTKFMIKGQMQFTNQDTNEIIISQNIARKFGLSIGDKAVLYSLSPEEMSITDLPNIASFIVKGIYSTGMAQYDDVVCYVPLKAAQRFFGYYNNEVSNIDIMLDDVEKAQPMSLGLDEFLGYPYYALTVFDTHQSIFNWIELQRGPIPIVLGLISLVAVFNLISILLILVLDKTKSIGILRAVGLPANKIRLLFLQEGLRIAIKGILIGCTLALSVSLIQKYTGILSLDAEIYYLDKVPVDIKAWHYLLVAFVTILMSAVASTIPAIAASKVSPIKAIRYK